jgi:hypothetical protein
VLKVLRAQDLLIVEVLLPENAGIEKTNHPGFFLGERRVTGDGGQVKPTQLTREQTVRILKTLALPEHRDFRIAFSNIKPRKYAATYLRRTRTITINAGRFESAQDILGAGLHEMAHHIDWETNTALHQRKRIKTHGKEFRRVLRGLVAAFNHRYGDVEKGWLVFNPRKPTRCPRFVKF